MGKFKIKLLYNEEELLCTKTELLNFKITLPLTKLDILGSRLVSNGLFFSVDILVDIQLVTFSLRSNIRELSIRAKTRKFSTLPHKKSYPFSDICATLFVKSVIFFSISTCFVLFEVTFLLKCFSLSWKFVFISKSAIPLLLAKFASAKLAAKFSDVILLNARVVIYLS